MNRPATRAPDAPAVLGATSAVGVLTAVVLVAGAGAPGPRAVALAATTGCAVVLAIVVAGPFLRRHRDAERRRAVAIRRFESIVDQSPVGIVQLGLDRRLAGFNAAAERLLDLGDDDIGRPIGAASGHGLLTVLAERWAELSELSGPVVLDTVEVATASGAGHFEVRVAPIDGPGESHDLLAVVSDVSELVRRRERISELTLTDALTGLPNRVALLDRLGVALRQLDRRRSGHGVAVVVVDVDHFRELNDSLGHEAGDELLGAVGLAISGAIRGADTVGRLGGDEFLVVSTQVADADSALELGERIRRRVADLEVELDGDRVAVAVSVGCAWTNRLLAPDELLARADRAITLAKARRGPLAVVRDVRDDGCRDGAADAAQLERDVLGALERHELELWYQPIVDADGCVVAAEALLRWRHPERGILLPGVFLRPLMEAGKMRAVGRWVVAEALRVAAPWESAGPPMSVHVNLSPLELSSGVIDDLHDELRRSGVSPEVVCVEVTEQVFGGVLISTGSVAELGATGARIALDDFGMGISSISHLRHRPLHAIKLDRALVAGIGDEADESIIGGVMDIATSLGLDVVAEGVESPEQAAWLRERGCRRFQGFLYGCAVPATDVVPGARLGPDPAVRRGALLRG